MKLTHSCMNAFVSVYMDRGRMESVGGWEPAGVRALPPSQGGFSECEIQGIMLIL